MGEKYYLSLFLVSFGLFLIGVLYGLEKSNSADHHSTETVDFSGGMYIRLVFIGSSDCIYANNSETHRMVSTIKNELSSVLEKASIQFITTGVSHDLSSTIGMNYLEKTGPYDEILVGGGPFNLGIIHYASSGLSTPRLLLFLEKYETDVFGMNMNNFYNAQELLKSYTGQYEIQDLYEFLQNTPEGEIIDYFGLNRPG